MCQDCGCSQPGPAQINGKPESEVTSPLVSDQPKRWAPLVHSHPHDHSHEHPHNHDHSHAHEHGHEHIHPHSHPHPAPGESHQYLEVRQPILAANDRIAERNRGYFKALGLLSLNVVSSPGSGKTSLIQRTVERLGGRLRAGVIVGDLATDNDAQRLRAGGARAIQITTGTLCHLEAGMVARALSQLDAQTLDVVIIENVGNLVCPASFDLGEELRVVLLSVTEGEDKPLKYPPMFHSADVVLINKMDLATAVEFQHAKALAHIRLVSPHAEVFEVSARTGAGLDAWCDYLIQRHEAVRRSADHRREGDDPAGGICIAPA
jgi:hydrogenase nickel incorporation protein HypB